MSTENVEVDAYKTKVFLSYSRKDLAFARRLELGLDARGLETFVDLSDIEAFEDWQIRTETLIRNADAVIFVVSPYSVQSKTCLEELRLAESLNKRLAPVVLKEVDPSLIPESLRRLNFISFQDEDRFEIELSKVVTALTTDITWVRRHTEMTELAYQWHSAKAGRRGGLWLRSPILEEAEAWIAARPRGAPPPTNVTREFIAESRRTAGKRRNTIIAILAAGLIGTTALAGLFYWERGIANTQTDRANEQAGIAKQQTAKANAQTEIAKAQTELANVQTEQAQSTVSKLLAEQAVRLNAEGDNLTATLTSLEAFRGQSGTADRYELAAEKSLGDAVYNSPLRAILTAPDSPFIDAEFSFNGQDIVSVQESGKVSLWRWSDGKLIRHDDEDHFIKDLATIKRVTANPAKPIYIFLAKDGSVVAWNYQARKKLDQASGRCDDDDPQIDFNASGDNLFLLCGQELKVFDFSTGVAKQFTKLSHFSMAGNKTRFLIYNGKRAQLWDAASLKTLNTWASEELVDAWLNFQGDRVFETYGTDHPKDVGGQPGAYRVRIKDGHTGKVIVDDLLTQGRTFDVGASGDGHLFATGGDEGIKVWSNQQAPAVIQQIDGENASFTFLSNGLLLVEDGKKLTAWQYVTDTRLGHYYTTRRAVLHWRDDHSFLATNRDNSEILTLSEEGVLLLWSLKPPMLLRANDKAAECIGSVVIARDAHLIAALGSFKPINSYLPSGCAFVAPRDAVIIWDEDTLKERKRLDLARFGRLDSLSIDDAGARILVTTKAQKSEDDANNNLSLQQYEVLDLATGKTLLKNETGTVYASAISSDGATVAVSEGNKISIFNVREATVSRNCNLANSLIVGKLTYSDDPNKLALADTTGGLSILDTTDCKLSRLPISVGQMRLAVDLKFKGQLVAAQLATPDPEDSGASNNRLVVWSEADHRLVFNQLLSSTEYGTPFTIFSDRSRLVRASGPDGQRDVLAVDVGSQRELLSFPIDFNGCCQIVALHLLNSDRELLTVWSERNVTRMRVWRVFHSIDELKSYARDTAPECLSPEDRRIRGLDSEPPRWCIELSKYPFDSPEWREWLHAKDAGRIQPLPN